MKWITKTKIADVKQHEDGRWTWTVDGKAYATNKAGNGIFEEDESGHFIRQKIGTCDFKACKTVSGMRKKLKDWFCSWEPEY